LNKKKEEERPMNKKIWIGVVATLAGVLAFGCSTEAADDNNDDGVEEAPVVADADSDDDEDVESTSSALEKGGCTPQQIKAAQASCRRVHGAKSRGVIFCNKYGPAQGPGGVLGGYGYKCSVRK